MSLANFFDNLHQDIHPYSKAVNYYIGADINQSIRANRASFEGSERWARAQAYEQIGWGEAVQEWGEKQKYGKGFGTKARWGLGKAAIGAERLRQGVLSDLGQSSITKALYGSNLKQFAKSTLKSGAFFGALDLGFQYYSGQEIGMGSAVSALTHGVAIDLMFKMAGKFSAGLGWDFIGQQMGMGPFGTLAMMGGTYLAGAATGAGGMATVGAIGGAVLPLAVAYGAGRAAYIGLNALHSKGKEVQRTNFMSGDFSFASSNAATMRQRALSAIQDSHMNARAMLGNEATTYMRGLG